MPDPRFFESRGPFRLGELAELAGAVLSRPDKADTLIDTAGPLTRVGAAGISFFADRRYRQELRDTAAAACFLREAESQHAPEGCVSLFTNEPHAAYAMVADQLHPVRRWTPHDQIHPSAVLEEGVGLAPGVVIGPGAQVGRGTVLGPYAVIGPGVCIGRDCVIGAQVSIGFALIGDRVKVMAGAVIGEPGFGVTTSEGKALDVPQLGRVIIQDGVSVGAGTCIDRGAWDDTVIGERTKIDNLVQIAHNVRLGRNCLLAAHTGISGSCDIGDGVAFGGRAGIADHIRVGDGARIAAAAGVMKDVPAGEMWVGSPARPIRRFMRETAWLAKMAKTRAEGPDE